jgi:phage terminase large subunit GpA-like protein
MKTYLISTPENKDTSNILPAYLAGDRRRYHIPCTECGAMIYLDWSIDIDEQEKAGITWKLDKSEKIIDESVGYICQECAGFIDESHKYEMNIAGEWRATAEPERDDYTSYHLSSLYAPPGMKDWKAYVHDYLQANPQSGQRDEGLYKTFMNLGLGECWEDKGEEPKANMLQTNQRDYQIDEIPEELSIRDGNGKIVLITCAADLNGKEDDARIDYEIVAWSETGANYSIRHGSIGTFVPRENTLANPIQRETWSYHSNKEKNVWDELEQVINQDYYTDNGRSMKPFMTGIDAPSHFATFAYNFIDNTNSNVVALKGRNDEAFTLSDADKPLFTSGKERNNLYMIEVNRIKDHLASHMKLNWQQGENQPNNYMNFPESDNGLYTYSGYFVQFESEQRVSKKKGEKNVMRWEKKNAASQNHFWDVRVYNIALKEIVTDMICRELKMKHFGWNDFVDIVLGDNRITG